MSRLFSNAALGRLWSILALIRGRIVSLQISRACIGFSGAAATLRAHSSICCFRFGIDIPPHGPNILPRYLVALSGLTHGIRPPSISYGAVSLTVNVLPSDFMWKTYDLFTLSRRPTWSQKAFTSARFFSSPALESDSTAVSSAYPRAVIDVISFPHPLPSLSRLQNMGSRHTLNRIGERGSPCLTP